MSRYRLYQVDSFTKEKFTGNPAGVVSNADGLSDDKMQKIAREMNCSETAFMLSPETSDHERPEQKHLVFYRKREWGFYPLILLKMAMTTKSS